MSKTYIDGELVAKDGKSFIQTTTVEVLNNFNCALKNVSDFEFALLNVADPIYAIEALDGQLITHKILCNPLIKNGFYESNIAEDFLKIIVINRYKNAPIAKGFIKNFGLKKGTHSRIRRADTIIKLSYNRSLYIYVIVFNNICAKILREELLYFLLKLPQNLKR